MGAPEFSHGRLPAEDARKKIKAKLVHGQDSAVRLQSLLRSAAASEHDGQALVTEILNSFTEAISVLDSASDEPSFPDHSLCSDLDSDDSRRSTAVKNLGRGNKRRRLTDTKVVTMASTEDGYAWRKYGQKAILNTTYPKSYFRCTHKYDQSCGATKHVQRMEGDSETMYKITYISNHTCGQASPIVVSNVAATSDSSNLICFSSDSPNSQLTEGTSNSFLWPSDDNAAKDVRETAATTSCSTDDVDIWLNLKDFGSSQATTGITMTTDQYYVSNREEDAYSFMFWDD